MKFTLPPRFKSFKLKRPSFKRPDPFYLMTLLVAIYMVSIPLLWNQVRQLQAQVKTIQSAQGAGSLAATTPAPAGPMPKVSKDDHIVGTIDAQVILVEYSDTECPFCKQFHPTLKQLKQEFGDKVAWVYRPYPLSFHQNAQKEAEAQECVAEQGGNDAFWKFTDAIFERTTSNGLGFALTSLAPLAKEQGLDDAKLQSCLDAGKYAKKVTESEAGGASAGVNGTPGTFLVKKNGSTTLLSGAEPIEQVKAAIEAALK